MEKDRKPMDQGGKVMLVEDVTGILDEKKRYMNSKTGELSFQ